MIRHALLALLREQPDYGYRLKLRFDERIGCAWRLNVGQVYQTLQALARSGLVRELATAHESEANGRRVFEITPKGLRALERWLRRPAARLRPVRDELLLRLLCLEPAQYGSMLPDIDRQQRACLERLAELSRQRARLQRTGPASPSAPLAIAAEMLQLTAQLEWLTHCRAVLGGAGGNSATADLSV